MKYTEKQKQQICENIQKIVDYIEKSILPHITYLYETGMFGPIETWGRCNENTGRRCRIALNGPYHDKIRFYHGDVPYSTQEIMDCYDLAVTFLQYWQDAKSYMNNEIQNNVEKIKLIETFEI